MMGFLGGRGRRRVARAEKRLRESPTPEAYISLARVCLDAGLGERALEVLRRGREQFPDSAELALFHDEVCWSHLRQRARELPFWETLRRTFADVEPGEPLAYIGSTDRLEIAARNQPLRDMLGVETGETVTVRRI